LVDTIELQLSAEADVGYIIDLVKEMKAGLEK